MDNRTALRTGGIAAIVSAVCFLLANALLGSPPLGDDSLPKITAFLADKHDTFRASLFLAALALAGFLVFLGVIVALVRSREGAFSPHASIGALTGVATITGVMVSLSAVGAAAFRAGPAGNTQAVRALFDVSNELGTVVNATGAVSILVLTLGVRRYALLPSWAVIIGFVAAGLTLIGLFGVLSDSGAFVPGGVLAGLLPALAAMVWQLSWGIGLLRARGQDLPAA